MINAWQHGALRAEFNSSNSISFELLDSRKRKIQNARFHEEIYLKYGNEIVKGLKLAFH